MQNIYNPKPGIEDDYDYDDDDDDGDDDDDDDDNNNNNNNNNNNSPLLSYSAKTNNKTCAKQY